MLLFKLFWNLSHTLLSSCSGMILNLSSNYFMYLCVCIQGQTKVGLQLGAQETQSLFLRLLVLLVEYLICPLTYLTWLMRPGTVLLIYLYPFVIVFPSPLDFYYCTKSSIKSHTWNRAHEVPWQLEKQKCLLWSTFSQCSWQSKAQKVIGPLCSPWGPE